jgi:hypothetical protein
MMFIVAGYCVSSIVALIGCAYFFIGAKCED